MRRALSGGEYGDLIDVPLDNAYIDEDEDGAGSSVSHHACSHASAGEASAVAAAFEEAFMATASAPAKAAKATALLDTLWTDEGSAADPGVMRL